MEILDKNIKIQKLLENGYDFDINKYLSEGWDLFKNSAGLFILYALLVFVINSFIPFAGLVVGAVLFSGYYLAAHKIETTGTVKLEDFFKSFDFFLPLFLAGLVGGILVAFGFVLLIIPGLWLAVALSFSYQLIVFEGMDFWESIETSVKIVNKRWFNFLLLWLIMLGINILGAIPLGLGLLITFPYTALVFYSCYKHVVGLQAKRENDLTDHMV